MAAVAEKDKVVEQPQTSTPKKEAPAKKASTVTVQSGASPTSKKTSQASGDAANKTGEKKAATTPKKPSSSGQSGEATSSSKSTTSGVDETSKKENNNKQPVATKTPAVTASTQSPSTASNESKDVDSSGNNGNSENRPRRRRFNSNRQGYVPYSVLLKRHEEEQKAKKILDSGVTGTVKWFSLRYHYGFIARDDGKGDVFVHQMNIIKSRMNRIYLRSLAHNEKVEFDVVEGKSGPEASNVTGPGGSEVQGVYVIQLRYPFRRNNDNMGFGNRRRRNTSGNERRQRRRTENEDDGSTQAPQRRNRRNRVNRNRTISGNNVEEKLVNALADNVAAIQVAN